MAGNLVWVRNVSGATQPWLVASEDHLNDQEQPRLFLLKNFCSGVEHVRVVEYICARFAHELGIGAPRVELLELTPEFLQHLRKYRPDARGVERAVPGLHMGVAWHENAIEIAQHADALSGLATNTQVAGIVVCDTCLQNVDRHQGNLLIRPHIERQRYRQILVPIDWGSCFNCVPPEPNELRAIRERRTISSGLFLTEAIHGAEEFGPIMAQLSSWSGQVARVRSLVEWLPSGWDIPERWRLSLVEHLLRRIEVALGIFSDAEMLARLFPNWQYDALRA